MLTHSLGEGEQAEPNDCLPAVVTSQSEELRQQIRCSLGRSWPLSSHCTLLNWEGRSSASIRAGQRAPKHAPTDVQSSVCHQVLHQVSQKQLIYKKKYRLLTIKASWSLTPTEESKANSCKSSRKSLNCWKTFKIWHCSETWPPQVSRSKVYKNY